MNRFHGCVRFQWCGAFLLAALVAGSAGGDESAPAASPMPAVSDADDVLDILYCSPRRPQLIRLHVLVKGEGYCALRRRWADSQFALLDSDKNGRLEGAELERIPAREILQPVPNSDSASLPPADSAPADGIVSPEEFRRYLLSAVGLPFTIEQAPTQGNDQVDLFPKLDQNGDGKLTPDEIESVAQRLHRYDQNEDDVLDVNELRQSLVEQGNVRPQFAAVLALLGAVDPAQGGAGRARRLLEGYDKMARDPVARVFRKDEQLTAAELAIDPASFARADRNGNGKLDRAELAGITAVLVPTVELEIHAPDDKGFYSVKVLRRPDPQSATQVDAVQVDSVNCRLTLDDTTFELQAKSVPGNIEQELRNNYVNNFRSFDNDNNEYIDAAESNRFGSAASNFFRQADVDRDGKVFKPEYIAQVERELALSMSSVTLTLTGESRSLFRLLDDNGDGRLSIRELRDASARFATWDADGDRTISLPEMSVRLQAFVSAGMPRVNGPLQFTGRILTGTGVTAARTAPGGDGTPSWFTKMDKNRDGDLSPREFLGGRALFDKFDTNHDGLLSVAEAKEAEKSAPAKQ